MKKSLLLTLTLFLAATSMAATVNLKDYATPNDGQDDSAGFQKAVDDLKKAGGGTLLIGEGTWDLSSGVNLVTNGDNVSFLLQGDKGPRSARTLDQPGSCSTSATSISLNSEIWYLLAICS